MTQCDRCARCQQQSPCDIWLALGDAWWSDGYVTDEIAVRMGVPDDPAEYLWACPEYLPEDGHG